VLGNSVEIIEDRAFYNCGFSSITLPASISEIGYGVFSSCKNLTSIIIAEANLHYTSDDGVLYSKDKSTLHSYLSGRKGNFSIPDVVRIIEQSAFSGCTGLTSVTIPNTIQSIRNEAFFGCQSLVDVTIPASVQEIGDPVFSACRNLTNIYVSDNNPNYSSIDGILFNKEKTTLINYPAGRSGHYAVPYPVSEIGRSFYGCNVTSVSFPNTITEIGMNAFRFCNDLTFITIPSSVTTIGYEAFGSCDKLNTMTVDWPIPLENISEYAFLGGVDIAGNDVYVDLSKSTLIVPYGTKKLYQNAAVWNKFGIIKEKPLVSNVDAQEVIPVGQDNSGNIKIGLNIPAGTQVVGGFMAADFPPGMYLDGEKTTVVIEGLQRPVIIGSMGNSYSFIKSMELKSAKATNYQTLLTLAYHVDDTVKQGSYTAYLRNVNLELSNGSYLIEDNIPITINVARNATSNDQIEVNEANVSLINSILYLQTKQTEKISLFTINGSKIYEFTTQSGMNTINVSGVAKGVLIVRSNKGWVKKIIKK